MYTNTPYEFWFESDGKKILLPVTPEKITVKNARKNENIAIADLGEVTLFKERSLEQISFSGIFPGHYFPGCNVKKPATNIYYTTFFKSRLDIKAPVRFTVTKMLISSYFTIEEFTYSERGGDVGTAEFSISLKAYRKAQIRQIKLVNKTAEISRKTTARVNSKTIPKTYTVKSGDCLFNIAKKYYGDGSQFTKIYNANKNIIGANSNLIYPGQVLTIP